MTEPDLPYPKPGPEIPPETNEVIPPSPDVKNPLPNHEPIEKGRQRLLFVLFAENPSILRRILICIWKKTMDK